VLRRRRGGEPARPDPGDSVATGEAIAPEQDAGRGPWDSEEGYPEADRIDCGSLLVPVRDGTDVQINVNEEQGIWVAVVRGESGMQLQAFAAPRREALWGEVRQEIADNVAQAGGTSQDAAGPFGPELHASVAVTEPGQPEGTPPPAQQQQLRFIGADGPRWFLRGMISGPAASDQALAAEFEEVFADVVVVRGSHPKPPKEQLEIRLPEEARQALEAQLAAEGFELPGPLGLGQDDPGPG
jgi:hypothetical protein